MKKLLTLTAAFLSLILLTSCTQTGTDEPSVSSQQSGSESSQSQSAEDPNSLEIKLTPELVEQNRMNLLGCGKLAEDERSVYYRHPLAKSLYRYDKKTGEQKELYSQNLREDEFCSIDQIQLFGDRIYFTDLIKENKGNGRRVLLSVDRNGGNLTKLIEGVYDEYLLTKDSIYYSMDSDPAAGNPYALYEYRFDTKEQKCLVASPCYHLTMDHKNLYFTGDAYGDSPYKGLNCYQLDTGKLTAISTERASPKSFLGFYSIYYHTNLLYFTARSDSGAKAVGYYDISSGECGEIIDSAGMADSGALDSRIFSFYVIEKDHFYIVTIGTDSDSHHSIVEIKDGKVLSVENLSKTGEQEFAFSIVDDKKVFYDLYGPIKGYPQLNNTVTK
jgi:hypothetical protein